jgi:hypothetical protein
MKRLVFVAVLAVAATTCAIAFGAVPPGSIYDSTVHPRPANLPSEGPEAYAFNELGDQVTFAGTDRHLTRVQVTLSSWACQSGHWYTGDCVTGKHATFPVPITFNVYNPATNGSGVPVAGSLIATQTKTFQVRYRPSANHKRCTGDDAGKWYKKNKGCFNGRAANVKFDFKSENIALPDTVVYGISYNTTDFGPSPIGQTACNSSSGGCFYDSLNIALAPAVNLGSQSYPGAVFLNAGSGGAYCDGGTHGVGIMRLDSGGCWNGLVPAVNIAARK